MGGGRCQVQQRYELSSRALPHHHHQQHQQQPGLASIAGLKNDASDRGEMQFGKIHQPFHSLFCTEILLHAVAGGPSITARPAKKDFHNVIQSKLENSLSSC